MGERGPEQLMVLIKKMKRRGSIFARTSRQYGRVIERNKPRLDNIRAAVNRLSNEPMWASYQRFYSATIWTVVPLLWGTWLISSTTTTPRSYGLDTSSIRSCRAIQIIHTSKLFSLLGGANVIRLVENTNTHNSSSHKR